MAATSAASGATGGRERDGTAEEAALARAAAGGDGPAFATLYDRYEGRIFNFCNRLLASPDDAADATQEAFLKVLQRLPKLEDRELNFSAYMFTAARNASYDVIGRRKRAEPTDDVPEPTAGREPGDLYVDPERAAMLGTLQDDVRDANGRLPERQREVLVLRELEELSYDEIAEIMDMNRNSVAQLISRARIRLRDELRGTALAAVAASSPECERALPLIAMRQDRQLDDPDDRAWLAEHLGTCDTCRVAQEAIQEAGISYRAWLPIVPGAWLWHATAAKAAELVGADWSDLAREHSRDAGRGRGGEGGGGTTLGNGAGARGAAAAATVALPAVEDDPVEATEDAARHVRLLAGGLVALFLLLGFSTAVAIGTDGAPQRLFDSTGGSSFSTPSALGATGGAAATAATNKPKHKQAASGNIVPLSTTTGAQTTGQGTGTTTSHTKTHATPHHRSTRTPNGNSVGGEENGSSSTPSTSTPSVPAPPSIPTPPAGGTPPTDTGTTPPSDGGTAPPPCRPSATRPSGC